jgi:hypothetical protein
MLFYLLRDYSDGAVFDKKFALGTVENRISALRLPYKKTLKRSQSGFRRSALSQATAQAAQLVGIHKPCRGPQRNSLLIERMAERVGFKRADLAYVAYLQRDTSETL